jgi:hypothetical protein
MLISGWIWNSTCCVMAVPGKQQNKVRFMLITQILRRNAVLLRAKYILL